MATDLSREIRNRLRELARETEALEKALEAIEGAGPSRRGPGRPPGSGKRGPGRPAGSGSNSGTGGVRRRRRRGGTRAEQALKAIAASPGITVSEIAKALAIQPNYVYRVMHELRKDGKIKKQGKGYAAS